MDHTEAVEKNLTESYLLGELTPQECEAFEEHYFTCAECAEDIKAAAALFANVKHVLKEAPALSATSERAPSAAGWFSWWRPAYSFAAVAAVLAVLIYQNVVTIPGLKNKFPQNTAPQLAFTTTYSFIGQGSRSDSPPISIAYQDGPVVLEWDITTSPIKTGNPNSANFVSYTCVIQTESGTAVLPEVTVTAEQAKNTISLIVPGPSLQPGKYDLIVRGNPAANQPTAAGVETTQHHPFVVESKNEGTAKP